MLVDCSCQNQSGSENDRYVMSSYHCFSSTEAVAPRSSSTQQQPQQEQTQQYLTGRLNRTQGKPPFHLIVVLAKGYQGQLVVCAYSLEMVPCSDNRVAQHSSQRLSCAVDRSDRCYYVKRPQRKNLRWLPGSVWRRFVLAVHIKPCVRVCQLKSKVERLSADRSVSQEVGW